MQAGISTNGLMLDKHVDTLAEYFDTCSNIRFSIDGVKKETYENLFQLLVFIVVPFWPISL